MMDHSTRSRFLRYIPIGGADECWEWKASCTTGGYGQFGFDGKNHLAHRLQYEEVFGEIPKGLVIRHKCHNRKCVNPNHLLSGTQKDNIQDAVAEGRMSIGSRNGRSLLTEREVLEIRELHHSRMVSLRTLADKYGVSNGAIQNIVYRRSWQYL